MTDCQLMYRRDFDWFNLVYPPLVVGGFFWLFSLADGKPLQNSIFWILAIVIIGGQGFYFFERSRSPTELALDGDELVIKWTERETRIPAHHLRWDESSGNSNSQTLWCSGRKIKVFADIATITKITEAIAAREADAFQNATATPDNHSSHRVSSCGNQ